MSFSINTNVNSMVALNNLNMNQNQLSNSIQQLSSGLRINSAADDPAGLILGSQFQAQLTGINQAISNSQDAMNFAKTADGALGQISSLLNSARGLAVAASNTGVLSSSEVQADNTQLQSIVSSINRIAGNTQFGTKYLLNGSSGVSASVTDGTKLASLNIGGTFGGAALTTGGAATLTVTAAATQALVTLTHAYASVGAAEGTAGSFSVNGTTFTTTATDTAQSIINKINQSTGQTGVVATYNSGANQIVLNSQNYGSGQTINVADANGSVLTAAGSASASGTDAAATLKIGATTVNFTGGLSGNDGLTLSDANGNTFRLTSAGNSTGVTNATIGQVSVGSAQFQIGANAGQTASISIANFAASNLGTNAVSGLNMSNLDLSTFSGAQNAIQVIDSAINQVASNRGQIGAFQADILNPNVATLSSAQQNLSASYSNIMDANVAQTMTAYTQQQIVQQAGMSVLAQANSMPQMVLKLLG